jgi:hypothetical protein
MAARYEVNAGQEEAPNVTEAGLEHELPIHHQKTCAVSPKLSTFVDSIGSSCRDFKLEFMRLPRTLTLEAL